MRAGGFDCQSAGVCRDAFTGKDCPRSNQIGEGAARCAQATRHRGFAAGCINCARGFYVADTGGICDRQLKALRLLIATHSGNPSRHDATSYADRGIEKIRRKSCAIQNYASPGPDRGGGRGYLRDDTLARHVIERVDLATEPKLPQRCHGVLGEYITGERRRCAINEYGAPPEASAHIAGEQASRPTAADGNLKPLHDGTSRARTLRRYPSPGPRQRRQAACLRQSAAVHGSDH